MKNITLIIAAILLGTVTASAQGFDEKLFENLHGHASFNVVFAVLLVILLGVLVYLWQLDRKVNKLLKEVKK